MSQGFRVCAAGCLDRAFKDPGAGLSGQVQDHPVRIFSFQKTRVLVETGGSVTDALFIGLPLGGKSRSFSIGTRLGDLCLDAEKGGLDKGPDLPLPLYDHPQHTGHDPSDRDGRVVCPQGPAHGVAVAQRQRPGEIDAHQIVLLGTQIGRRTQVVIGGGGLRLPDAAQDLLLGLGVDPDTELFFPLHSCLGGDEAVDILPLPPGVCADIDRSHIRIRQDPLYDPELLFHPVDHLVTVLFRNKGDRVQGPPFEGGIVGIRIGHGDQVSHAPGDDGILRLHETVGTAEVLSQRRGEGTRHTGLFRDIHRFRSTHPLSSVNDRAG